jgi:hypothetical protein
MFDHHATSLALTRQHIDCATHDVVDQCGVGGQPKDTSSQDVRGYGVAPAWFDGLRSQSIYFYYFPIKSIFAH